MASNRIGGTLTFTIDGNTYQVRGNFTVKPNRVKREWVAGQDKVHGYIEQPVVPGCKGDFTATPGVPLNALQTITNSTVQVTLANGATYVLANAAANPDIELKSTDGSYPLEIGCLSCTEIVSAG